MTSYEKEKQYFASTNGVIEVFEFDYDSVTAFQIDVSENSMWAGCLCGSFFCMPCWYACGKPNLIDDVQSQHVCLTHDGIRYVKERHKAGCRMDCDEQGRVTKTVPFDKLTDCDLEEPAGKSGPLCCMTPNVLTKVNVDTASGGRPVPGQPGVVSHELTLVGLVDPHKFKNMVWQLKREGVNTSTMASAAPAHVEMTRIGHGQDELAPLLESQNKLIGEQNRLLSEQNQLLKGIKENTAK